MMVSLSHTQIKTGFMLRLRTLKVAFRFELHFLRNKGNCCEKNRAILELSEIRSASVL